MVLQQMYVIMSSKLVKVKTGIAVVDNMYSTKQIGDCGFSQDIGCACTCNMTNCITTGKPVPWKTSYVTDVTFGGR